jgi:outer membrane protein assembly factor BamB
VWDKGALLVPASVYRFGGTFKLDLTDGSTISGGISDQNATPQIAVADGQVAVRSGFVTSTFIGITTVAWKYRPGVLFQSSAPGVFAIVGDRIQWVWGAQALGFSAACPSYPPPYPSNIGCAPDWTTTLGGSATAPTGVGTDGVVYGDASGRVSVLDTATGAVRWAAELGSPIGTAPAVTADSIFVGTQDGRLVALDAGTGAKQWEANLGGTPGTSPVVGGDVAYVGLTGATGDLVAVAAHGCGAATCPTLKTVSARSPITGGPIVDDGRLLVGTEGGDVMAFGLVT